MDAREVLSYLRSLCRDIDDGRPFRLAALRRLVAPLALPAAVALGVGLSACESESECYDGVDNDHDRKIDCCDVDCFGETACEAFCPAYGGPYEEDNCHDCIDGPDCDGLTDCEDPDCAGIDGCPGEQVDEVCGDGLDNDGDNNVDCDDVDCFCSDSCRDAGNCED
jgi:hypothetical protein